MPPTSLRYGAFVGTAAALGLLVVLLRRRRKNEWRLEDRLTVILCTSPVRTNPSTALIEETVGSIRHFASTLGTCPTLVVCDGYKIRPEARYRSGQVTVEGGEKYEDFLRRLEGLRYGKMVRCPERLGFGFALKRALTYVRTPYVIIIQHDRNFRRRVDINSVVKAMENSGDSIKYVGFPTGTTLGYQHFVLSKYGIRVESEPLGTTGMDIVPLIQWYDSTHICSTKHYRDFVYRGDLVKKGGFIEDKLGQKQLADIRANGLQAHKEYSTYVLDDGVDEPIVQHLDGHDALSFRKFQFVNNPTWS